MIEGDQVNIKYNDSIVVTTTTVMEDSVLVFDPNPAIVYNNFFVGDFEDPILQNSQAELGTQLWPNVNPPDFNGAIFDSLVLVLRYDSTNTYGDIITDPYNIGVYRLEENFDLEQKYYSNKQLVYDDMELLGETGDFFPKIASTDTLIVIDYGLEEPDTIVQPASLRIHLSEELANELMSIDSTTYASTTAFLEQFNGLVVKGLSKTKGMLSFTLLSAVSGMTLYYHTETDQDTVYKQYKYIISPNGAYFSTFKHDFSNTVSGDSLVYVQAMSGPNIKVEIPDPTSLGEIIVNKAELVFTYAELPEDDPDFYTPMQRSIIAIEDVDEGNFAFINDVILGSSTGNNWFGGVIEESITDEGELVSTYSFNISAHFQNMVDGSSDNAIFIRAFPKQERANRAILYGPKHSKYPAKFILTYTELNPQ